MLNFRLIVLPGGPLKLGRASDKKRLDLLYLRVKEGPLHIKEVLLNIIIFGHDVIELIFELSIIISLVVDLLCAFWNDLIKNLEELCLGKDAEELGAEIRLK